MQWLEDILSGHIRLVTLAAKPVIYFSHESRSPMAKSTLDHFEESLQKDAEFRRELLSSISLEEGLKVAARHGHPIGTEDLEAWFALKEKGALADSALDGVVGGRKIAVSFPDVCAPSAPPSPIPLPYPNI